jgi:hypothetical protein
LRIASSAEKILSGASDPNRAELKQVSSRLAQRTKDIDTLTNSQEWRRKKKQAPESLLFHSFNSAYYIRHVPSLTAFARHFMRWSALANAAWTAA